MLSMITEEAASASKIDISGKTKFSAPRRATFAQLRLIICFPPETAACKRRPQSCAAPGTDEFPVPGILF
jgi:hypothetical protein